MSNLHNWDSHNFDFGELANYQVALHGDMSFGIDGRFIGGGSSDYNPTAYSLPLSNDTLLGFSLPLDTPISSHSNSNSHGNSHSSSHSHSHSASPTTLPTSPKSPPPRRLSGSRFLVPQHSTLSRVSSHNAITKLSASRNAHGPSALGGGPSRKTYTIPPRPKPGRKPATDEPASKRKAQNRESQRAFRARKAAKVAELVEQVEAAEARHKTEMAEKLAEIDHLESLIRTMENTHVRYLGERDYWREQYQQLLDRSGPSSVQQDGQNPFTGQSMPMLFAPSPTTDAHNDTPRRLSLDSTPAIQNSTFPDPLGCSTCEPDNCACIKELGLGISFQDNSLTPMDAVPLPSRSSQASPVKEFHPVNHAQMGQNQSFIHREIDFTKSGDTLVL